MPPQQSVTDTSASSSAPFTWGLTLEVWRSQVIRGVRMMVRDARLQGHSRVFLTVEEAEAVLSRIPESD